MDQTDYWKDVKALFPISSRSDANQAASLLLQLKPRDDGYWRAQAWFAYLAATAVLDWWDYRCAEWGEWSAKPRQVLWRDAKRLANEAVRNMPRTSKSDLYDALWARGFILVAEGDFVGALADYKDALALGGARKDAHILAEASDAAVYSGDIEQARIWIDEAFRTLEDMNPPKNPPKWFYWARAWVSVAEGAAALGDGAAKGVSAIQDLDNYNNVVPKDFDAAIVRLLAMRLANQEGDRSDIWAKYRKKVEQEKGVTWNRQLELARSPFNLQSIAAGKLYDLVQRVIPDNSPDAG